MRADKPLATVFAQSRRPALLAAGAVTAVLVAVAAGWAAVHVALGRVTSRALHPTSGWVVNEIRARGAARAEALSWLQGRMRPPNFCPPARNVQSDPAAVPVPHPHVDAASASDREYAGSAATAAPCAWRNLTALEPLTDLPVAPLPRGSQVLQCEMPPA